MTRRAMTLIELLAAVSLLGLVILAMAGWTQTAARTAASVGPALHWEQAAEAVLDQIHQDLTTGDLWQSNSNRRIQIVDDQLTIRTRDRGQSRHIYTFDQQTNRLSLKREADGTDKQPTSLLIEEVSSWLIDLDEDTNELRIAITSIDGQELTRRYRLP